MSDLNLPKVPKPDALRTRIARILYSQNAYEDWNGNEMTWEETSQAYRECWLHDADVLIRELDSHGWLIDPESGERHRMELRASSDEVLASDYE